MRRKAVEIAASAYQSAPQPTRANEPGAAGPLDLPAGLDRGLACPRVVRIPADWWDSTSAVGCPLSRTPQGARAARRLTRNTLRDWGLTALAEDAEAIVGEFVANAVTHTAASAPDRSPAGEDAGPAPASPHRRGDLRGARPE